MQRVHIGRIGGALLAIGIVVAATNPEAVSLMAMDAGKPARDRTPGINEIKVDIVGAGLGTILGGHRATWFPVMPVGAHAPRMAMKCSFDAARGRRICQSRHGSDSAAMVRAVAYRSDVGAAQSLFDESSTDTVTVQAAFINSTTDSAARPMTQTLRSMHRFAGTSDRSESRMLNGADTVLTTRQWSKAVRSETQKVVTYSEVSMSNDRSARFPASGMVQVSSASTNHNRRGTADHFSSMTVYFDGTGTPEAYINGIRYRLNLESGIATPLNGD